MSYFFVRILASIGGISWKLHNLDFWHLPYKRCKFGCDWSIRKGTLLGGESTFAWSTKYLLGRIADSIGEIFLKIQTLHFAQLCYKLCKFGCNQTYRVHAFLSHIHMTELAQGGKMRKGSFYIVCNITMKTLYCEEHNMMLYMMSEYWNNVVAFMV